MDVTIIVVSLVGLAALVAAFYILFIFKPSIRENLPSRKIEPRINGIGMMTAVPKTPEPKDLIQIGHGVHPNHWFTIFERYLENTATDDRGQERIVNAVYYANSYHQVRESVRGEAERQGLHVG